MARYRLSSLTPLALALAIAGCGAQPTTSPTPDGGMMMTTCTGHCSFPGLCCGNPQKCIDVSGDSKNCGMCNLACPNGTLCTGGKCLCGPKGMGVNCSGADTCCGAVGCKNLMSDVNNCGMCGRACKDNEACMAGGCQAVAACANCKGKCCNKTCVDTDADPANCGDCDNVCAKGETCGGGTCVGGGGKDGGMMGACQCTMNMPCPMGDQCLFGCCLKDLLGGKCMINPMCM
ncbi:MAG: hypothetical protein EXR72_09980 [Myxococcales bacterium]|nr:hypothetical protein [Myxococcales bacterium]